MGRRIAIDLNPTPAALITHTIIRVQGEHTGEITVYSAVTPSQPRWKLAS